MNRPASNDISAKETSVDEYIDLVDVIRFFWRARFYMLVAVLIGLSSAALVSFKLRPSTYIYSVPVYVDNRPGLSFDGVITKFNHVVSTSGVADNIFEQLVKEQDPRVIELIRKNGWTKDRFIGLQVGKDVLTPLKLVKSDRGNEYIIESKFNIRDEEGILTKALIAATHEFISARNLFVASSQAQDVNNDEMRELNAAINSFEQFSNRRMVEESETRLKLFSLEAKLSERLGSQAGAPHGGETDQVTRLLGYLFHSKKISKKEFQEITKTHATYLSRLEIIRIKYESMMLELGASVKKRADSIISREVDKDGVSPEVIPTLALIKDVFEERLANDQVERIESKRPLYFVVGIILGLVSGVFGFAVREFIRENSAKLRAIFRTQ